MLCGLYCNIYTDPVLTEVIPPKRNELTLMHVKRRCNTHVFIISEPKVQSALKVHSALERNGINMLCNLAIIIIITIISRSSSKSSSIVIIAFR